MPNTRLCHWLASVLSVVLLLAASAIAAAEGKHWPQWRGPSGQGYADDTRVPLTWSEGANLLWKTALPGNGNSSPIVWGDRIFLTAAGSDGTERYVLCIRAADGKILWQRRAATIADPGKTHEWNGYASSSCTTDGERVYAFFGTPGLFCYDFEGNLKWRHAFGLFTSETGWGTAASPFLFEDLLIQNCDNDGVKGLRPGQTVDKVAPMALVALDKRTGAVRWQAPRNQGRGFSTPIVVPTPQGRLDLVLNSPNGVWAYDPRTGKELWHADREGESGHFGEPIPVFNGDTFFVTSGRPGPFQAIRMGGHGDVTLSHRLWQVVRTGHRDVSSPILWEDCIYIPDSKGILVCHDAKTGKVLFEERLGAKALASPVAARGKLFFLLEDGATVVVNPAKTFQVVARNRLGDGAKLDFAASPAIAAGRMFLRSQSFLYCVGTK